jgi:MoaA/NifB/PqqE/SkfB family radical SAM enzyme
MVICETVNICCNNCIICPYGTMTRKKEVMSLEIFEKLLKEYSAMGGGKLSLTPKMGDIFFDPLLLKRLDLIRKYPKITGISVTTNAIVSDRFTDRELKEIISSFQRVHISVYGLDPEEYALMTRRDTYQRMIDNIRRIIAVSPRSCTLALGFRLLHERSPAEIDAWILKNFRMKMPYDFTSTFMDWGGTLDATQPLPLNGKWRPARVTASQCIMPLIACLVFSSGDVSFCSCNDHDIKEEFRLGNIGKKSLTEIINSPKNAKLWESSLNPPRSCKFCSSHRPIRNLEYYEDLFEDPQKFIGG